MPYTLNRPAAMSLLAQGTHRVPKGVQQATAGKLRNVLAPLNLDPNGYAAYWCHLNSL